MQTSEHTIGSPSSNIIENLTKVTTSHSIYTVVQYLCLFLVITVVMWVLSDALKSVDCALHSSQHSKDSDEQTPSYLLSNKSCIGHV